VTGDSYRLESIEVAMHWVMGDNEFFLFLMTDEGGRPGEVIEAFHIVGKMLPYFEDGPPILVPSANKPRLQKGARYWVAASATVETFALWSLNSTNDFGAHGHQNDDEGWTVSRAKRSAYRVTGVPILP
jgi:hypothetical protein